MVDSSLIDVRAFYEQSGRLGATPAPSGPAAVDAPAAM